MKVKEINRNYTTVWQVFVPAKNAPPKTSTQWISFPKMTACRALSVHRSPIDCLTLCKSRANR
jgi:hypothetical protein